MPVETVQPKETVMDLSMFLALAVAMLIIFSGYFLFNDVPRLGGTGTRRRR